MKHAVLNQHGKDLTAIKTVIGTGGILAYGHEPRKILEGVRFSENNRASLRPVNPEFYVDKSYVLFAAGLLAEMAPDKALRIIKMSLTRL